MINLPFVADEGYAGLASAEVNELLETIERDAAKQRFARRGGGGLQARVR